MPTARLQQISGKGATVTKNSIAGIIASAVEQGKTIGRMQTLKGIADDIDNERKASIENQFEGEYNRGYVDGLNKAYLLAMKAAKARSAR